MSYPAVALTRTATWNPQVIAGGNTGIALPDRRILNLGLVLIVIQILDGIFTAVGVSHFGVHSEGNPIIRSLMELWGPELALLAVKSVAVAVVCALCCLASKVRWIAPALRCVIAIYLIAAIIPWSGILLTRI